MSSSGRSAEFILEGGVARYRALSDQRCAVHMRRLNLRLATPVHRRSFTRNPINHVHYQDIVLANLTTKETFGMR